MCTVGVTEILFTASMTHVALICRTRMYVTLKYKQVI